MLRQTSQLHRLRHNLTPQLPGFVVESIVFGVGLLLFLLMFSLFLIFFNNNRRTDGEGVAGSDRAGGSSSLEGCSKIPGEWQNVFNTAAERSGADAAIIAAIFAAGEHRYYQGGENWPAYTENPPYGTGLNPTIHDGGSNGFVRGPTQFKEQTFEAFRGSFARDAKPSRFGGGFNVEPYIEQVTPALTATGNYLAHMGGKANADDMSIKRAIYGYYNGEGARYNENHFYVKLVFPAYQEFSGCKGGGVTAGGDDIATTGTYAPVLDKEILRRFIPLRPHHGTPSDPAMDIGVPTGTRSYAFTNGVITATFYSTNTFRPGSKGSGSCGIGFNMRGDDGQAYQYCHFSQRDSRIVEGARVTAGQFVGLTGNTGRSTGPHLHFGSPGPRTLERANALRAKVSDTVK